MDRQNLQMKKDATMDPWAGPIPEPASPMGDVAIRIRDLSKIFKLYDRSVDRLKESLHPLRRRYHREFYALRDVEFDVRRGETVGIIGRNGSGKSTLLKIIAGVLTPSVGTVEVNGRVSALLELGTGFNPDMTGMENIYFSGTIMGYSREEMDMKRDAIVHFADIGEFISQPVKIYSSGMFIRLAFAVAINVDPDILIVDEALSVGDISFQAKCYSRFNQFRSAGKTILFVTHTMDNVIRYCDRGIVLEGGRKLIETGTKEAVDVYKRLLVNCYGNGEEWTVSKEKREIEERWNVPDTARQNVNPNATVYGNGKAEIIGYGMIDAEGNPVQKLLNGERFSICMRIRFHGDVAHPIFAFTVRDLRGLEITGTNTHFRHIDTERCRSGEIVDVIFSQALNMQAGQYGLSLGCTNYEGDCFVVYHRLYDILLFEVISDRSMVGFYDLPGEIRIRRLGVMKGEDAC